MFAGNVIHEGDSYKRQYGIDESGRFFYEAIARARLTDVLQSAIALNIFSTKPNSVVGNFPPIPLQIPIGGHLERVDLRLPRAAAAGDEPIYGIDLPKNCTMIGTTGENLKVSPTTGTTHTVVSPVITSANNAYTPNSQAVLSRASGVPDAAAPSLLTTVTGAPLALQVSCSNAGNTAAGNGIRLSLAGTHAFIYARVIYSLPGDAVKPWSLDLPAMPG